MDRKTRRLVNYVSLGSVIILGFILLIVFLNMYFDKIDREIEALLDKEEVVYVSHNDQISSEGLIITNIKDNLTEFVKDSNVKSLIYEIDDEDFYFVLNVIRGEEISFDLEKVINKKLGINSMVNIIGINTLEYRTIANSFSTILKFNSQYDSRYMAMTDETHYFLGNDIEYVSYIDDHFYYLSYNPKYRALLDASECSKEVKRGIQGFNQNDYFYKYGKINFLKDYYQKLASKRFSVKDKCTELTDQLNSKE